MNNAAIARNHYGALVSFPIAALQLLNQAIASDKLDDEYNNIKFDRRGRPIGQCLNYDCYDFHGCAVLVQRRETTCTKYGSCPQKDYFIVRKCGRGVTVKPADKARVVKLSRQATQLGQVIDTLEGRAKKPLKQGAPFSNKQIAYKIVEVRDGSHFSVYDEDVEWALGKARIEAATHDHTGGFYVFPTIESAKTALAKNVVFADSWQAGKDLVLVECEIAGRREHHDNGKLCVTFCRPLRVIESLGKQAA